MIDLALIAAGAVSSLVPILRKGIDAISGAAAQKLYQWIADKFKSCNKQKDLEEFGKDPDNGKLQGKVETTIENILNENPSLVSELQMLIERAKADIVIDSKNVVTGNIQAGGNTIVGDNNSINSR